MSAKDDTPLEALGRVGIIGAGAVGTMFARVIAALGATVVAVAANDMEHARALASTLPIGAVATSATAVLERCDVIALAVPDDVIEPLARSLPWRPGQLALHFSGALGADALAVAATAGASVAALHPLMTFAGGAIDTPVTVLLERLHGCIWALEADNEISSHDLEQLVTIMGGQVIRLKASDRVPYHLAAVLVSNYVATLMGAAMRIWEGFGVPAELATQALIPLLQATVANVQTVGMPQALTGPIARGDLGVVAKHLNWLAMQASQEDGGAALFDAYKALGMLAAPFAERKGTLDAERAKALRILLTGAPQELTSPHS